MVYHVAIILNNRFWNKQAIIKMLRKIKRRLRFVYWKSHKSTMNKKIKKWNVEMYGLL